MSWALPFFTLLAVFLGYVAGWLDAHANVARECRRLGSFYVGKTTFRCVAIEDRADDDER